jgi:hypothetical protein
MDKDLHLQGVELRKTMEKKTPRSLVPRGV